MKPVLVTEVLTINNNQVTLSYRPENSDNNSPYLNWELGLAYISQGETSGVVALSFTAEYNEDDQAILTFAQPTDAEGNPLSLEDTKVTMQYLTMQDTRNLTQVPVTDTPIYTDGKLTLKHQPMLFVGVSPVLNFGTALANLEVDGNASTYMFPLGPDQDPNKANVTIDNPDLLPYVEGAEFRVEYMTTTPLVQTQDLKANIPVICTETLAITDGTILLNNDLGNLLDESPLLNRGMVLLIDETGIVGQALVGLVDGTSHALELLADSEVLAKFEGKQAKVQYTYLKEVDLESFTMDTTDIPDTTDDEPKTMHISELNIDPALLAKAKADAEMTMTAGNDEFIDLDDGIIDAEFTEVLAEAHVESGVNWGSDDDTGEE
jgi:hypothetical protein